MTSEHYLRLNWPGVFNDERLPLQIGIHRDLPTSRSYADVLERWTHHPRYLRNLISGGARYGLGGEPVGEVTDAQRQLAWETLKRKRANFKKWRSRADSLYEPPEFMEEMRLEMPKQPAPYAVTDELLAAAYGIELIPREFVSVFGGGDTWFAKWRNFGPDSNNEMCDQYFATEAQARLFAANLTERRGA